MHGEPTTQSAGIDRMQLAHNPNYERGGVSCRSSPLIFVGGAQHFVFGWVSDQRGARQAPVGTPPCPSSDIIPSLAPNRIQCRHSLGKRGPNEKV